MHICPSSRERALDRVPGTEGLQPAPLRPGPGPAGVPGPPAGLRGAGRRGLIRARGSAPALPPPLRHRLHLPPRLRAAPLRGGRGKGTPGARGRGRKAAAGLTDGAGCLSNLTPGAAAAAAPRSAPRPGGRRVPAAPGSPPSGAGHSETMRSAVL